MDTLRVATLRVASLGSKMSISRTEVPTGMSLMASLACRTFPLPSGLRHLGMPHKGVLREGFLGGMARQQLCTFASKQDAAPLLAPTLDLRLI